MAKHARDTVAWFTAVVLALALSACSSTPEPKGPPQFAELMPVAMMPPPPPPPPPPAPAVAPPPPPMPTGPMFGGHLASYSREAEAMRGWNNIVRQHSSIGTLKRHLVPAETPKGRMLRLIAGDFATLDEVQRFCTWAKQQSLYCAVMQLGADGMTATPLPPPARAARPMRPAQPAPAVQPAPAAPMQPAPAPPMQPAPVTPAR